jgi:peptidyl-prolyl cis-trans isomerase SurA
LIFKRLLKQLGLLLYITIFAFIKNLCFQMKFKYFFLFITFFSCFLFHAQEVNQEVLLEVGGDPVYTSEFMSVYNKNLNLVQDESQKDVDGYLKLFINYKLKLKEARTLGLDSKPSYKRELLRYRNQLANNFMSDNRVTEALVQEAYNRVSNEVKAQHILVAVLEDASPTDTLVAYNKILKLREETLNKGFANVMNQEADGKTVIAEQLGWFNGFKMVYNFENAAYNTDIGETSVPFKTRFGYHIVNVLDKRKSRGERTVAHIMIANKENSPTLENPELQIQDIYKKINQGEDFEALAKQFSEDKSSASKGGLVPAFSGGQLSAVKFEDVAFGLDEIGEVSKPFKTQFGWHIVKLYNKKPVQDFNKMKAALVQKVKRDERSKRIDNALYNKLKKTYNISDVKPDLDYFISVLNEDYFNNKWKLPLNFDGAKVLFEIDGKVFTYGDFGNYLVKTQRFLSRNRDFKSIVFNKYTKYFNENLVNYHKENLENVNPEFANVMTEYRDGLLLFDLMENTIWNSAKTDTLLIREFYSSNKHNYITPEQIDAVVASSSKQKTIKKVAKLLNEGMALERIKNLVNSNDAIEIIFTSGVMDANHQAIPKGFKFEKGISKIFKHNNSYEIIQVKDIFPETQKTFEEARGAVISDYQNDKEEKWVKTLADKYKVDINKATLKKVKSQINKQ